MNQTPEQIQLNTPRAARIHTNSSNVTSSQAIVGQAPRPAAGPQPGANLPTRDTLQNRDPASPLGVPAREGAFPQ
jgi:hypothetical protein